jgi:hypothetical protein
MPEDDAKRSNLAYFRMDTELSYNYNFEYEPLIPGADRSVKWSLVPIDYNKEAKAYLTVADRAGNIADTIISYEPAVFSIIPDKMDFGNVQIETYKTINFVLINSSKTRTIEIGEFNLKSIRENLENTGFTLNYDFKIGEQLKPGDARKFTVTFMAENKGEFIDSIGIGDSCLFNYKAQVSANAVINSISEGFDDPKITLSPNPTSDYIDINYDLSFLRMQESEIKIFNIFGECVLSTPSSLRDATPQEGNFKIDVSSLPAGVYFVRVGERMMKFMVVR